MEKRETWLSALVQDLAQRKVDTIVADGITGRAVPDPLTALLDIHNTYFRKLIRLGLVDLSKKADWGGIVDSRGWLLGNDAARNWLLERALEGLGRPGLKPAEACVLQRIVSTCGALEPIVAQIERTAPPPESPAPRGASVWPGTAAGTNPSEASRQYYMKPRRRPALELTRQDHAALSKAWELGVDTIALQTVAMLDGDMITRIADQYTGDSHAILRQIHREAVEISLSTWELLVKGIASFFDGLLGRRE
jgi:hypothetical protein